MSKDLVRRIGLRSVVAYPAVSIALVAAIALAFMSFGPARGMALAASIPMDITTPTATATETPSATPTTASTASPTGTPSPSTGAVTAPGPAPANHHVLARIEGPRLLANYLPVDELVADAEQFQSFRVRFRLHNAGTLPITVAPRLEFRIEPGGSFAVVPEQAELGIPFHLNGEWVPSVGLGGDTMQGPLGEDIAVGDLRIGKEGGLALVGHRSMGVNPDRPVTLPSDSYTEEEFTVTLSIDAKYLTGYELRITNGGASLTGTDVAVIRLGAVPPTLLSPGQHQGLPVPGPMDSSKPTSGTSAVE